MKRRRFLQLAAAAVGSGWMAIPALAEPEVETPEDKVLVAYFERQTGDWTCDVQRTVTILPGGMVEIITSGRVHSVTSCLFPMEVVRRDVDIPIPPGFKRSTQRWDQSIFENELHFEFVDEEITPSPPEQNCRT